MYCFAEHALTGAAEADRPTESDLMWLFGMIDFPIIVIYVLCYVAMGDWDKLVVDQIHDAGTCSEMSSGSGGSGAAPKTKDDCLAEGGEWEPAGGTLGGVACGRRGQLPREGAHLLHRREERGRSLRAARCRAP